VREVWYQSGPSPDHVVDVTDTFADKLRALHRHTTQTSHMDMEPFLRDRMATVARDSGLPDGRLAEAFTIIRTE
jgi:LmbE family N-acetylglucosaminyl deacetylase